MTVRLLIAAILSMLSLLSSPTVMVVIIVVLVLELGARGHPEVLRVWTSESCRREIEFRAAKRERWAILNHRAIDDRP